MGRRRGEETLVGNRRETLRASSHPASLYVQGNFAIAVGHSGHLPSSPLRMPSGGHGASGSLSAYSWSESHSASAQLLKVHAVCLQRFWKSCTLCTGQEKRVTSSGCQSLRPGRSNTGWMDLPCSSSREPVVGVIATN